MGTAIMPALVMGGIGAAASIYGANRAADGQKAMARQQARALDLQREQMAQQQQRYDQLREQFSPYVDSGQGALNQQRTYLGLNGADAQRSAYENFEFDPGYQESIKKAQEAMEARAAAQGRGGGNLLNALYNYNRDSIMNAYNQRYSQLGQMSGQGMQGLNSLAGVTGQQTSAANQLTGAMSNTLGNIGQAQAQGAYAQGAGAYGAGQSVMNAGLGAYYPSLYNRSYQQASSAGI